MGYKRVLGLILFIIGLALVLISIYIDKEVIHGKRKIASAQQQVDEGKNLFGLTPFTEPVGEELAAPAQRQIDQGREDVIKYEKISRISMIAGIILMAIGVILQFFNGKKKKSSR